MERRDPDRKALPYAHPSLLGLKTLYRGSWKGKHYRTNSDTQGKRSRREITSKTSAVMALSVGDILVDMAWLKSGNIEIDTAYVAFWTSRAYTMILDTMSGLFGTYV